MDRTIRALRARKAVRILMGRGMLVRPLRKTDPRIGTEWGLQSKLASYLKMSRQNISRIVHEERTLRGGDT